MAISLAVINRVVLRQVFLPWYRDLCQHYQLPLPANWDPSDTELERLAEALGDRSSESNASALPLTSKR